MTKTSDQKPSTSLVQSFSKGVCVKESCVMEHYLEKRHGVMGSRVDGILSSKANFVAEHCLDECHGAMGSKD